MSTDEKQKGHVIAMQIDIMLFSALINYVHSKPFSEVANLAGALQQATPIYSRIEGVPPLSGE